MKKWIILLALLAWPSVGWCTEWGGTAWQHADSVKMAHVRQGASYVTYNYGAHVQNFTGYTGTTDSFVMFIQPYANVRPGGCVDDSMVWHLFWDTPNSTPAGGLTTDTLRVGVFPLRRAWGEGTKTGSAAAAGECTWDSAAKATVAWGSPGAKNVSTDRYPAVDTIIMRGTSTTVDSMWWSTTSGYGPTKIGDAGEVKFKIPTASIPDAIAYGVVLEIIRNVGFSGPVSRWNTDNDGTSGSRPYPQGGYHTSETTALTAGAVTVGAVTVGGK